MVSRTVAMLTRRELMAAGAVVPAAVSAAVSKERPELSLPDKAAFFASGLTYLDSGSQHPISLAGRRAADAYFSRRMLDPHAAAFKLDADGLRRKFATLINAQGDEIAFVQSTTAGEQLVLRSLGFPEDGGHIVTDTLHFFGSMPIYEELAKRGVEVTWIRDRQGRIEPAAYKKAMRPGTRLIALSHVSTYNGFEHDLKAICDLAHDNGTLVYADMVHAAGCIPVDVKAAGVDFAACATYKWLMGDFGLGFLYARADRLPMLKRPVAGYYGLSTFQTHVYPLDPAGTRVADYAFAPTAMGMFAQGTHSHTVIAQLHHSLDYIRSLGVADIQRHAQGLTDQLKAELPKRGYTLLTPREAKTPLVTFQQRDANTVLGPLLDAARVKITLSANRGRVSPSVFNDAADIDRLLSVLPRASG